MAARGATGAHRADGSGGEPPAACSCLFDMHTVQGEVAGADAASHSPASAMAVACGNGAKVAVWCVFVLGAGQTRRLWGIPHAQDTLEPGRDPDVHMTWRGTSICTFYTKHMSPGAQRRYIVILYYYTSLLIAITEGVNCGTQVPNKGPNHTSNIAFCPSASILQPACG